MSTTFDSASANFSIARCGYMNALREKDFVRVPPGGKLDPYQKGSMTQDSSIQLRPRTFNSTGRYHVR